MHLVPLSPDKSECLDANLPTDVAGSFIRTGIEPSPSVFLRAISVPLKSYRGLGADNREEWIADQRKQWAHHVSLLDMVFLQGGSFVLQLFMEIAQEQLEILDKSVDTKIHGKNDLLSILLVLLPVSVILKEILPMWDMESAMLENENESQSYEPQVFYNHMKSVWYRWFFNYIVASILTMEQTSELTEPLMTQEERMRVVHKLSETSYELFDGLMDATLRVFQGRVEDPHESLEASVWMELWPRLAPRLQMPYQVLVLDAETMQITALSFPQSVSLPTVIVLFFPTTEHFESIGELLKNDSTDALSYVSRFFRWDHPCIQYWRQKAQT